MHARNASLALVLLLLAATSQAQESPLQLELGVQMKLAASTPRFEPGEIDLTFNKAFREQLGARLAQDLSRPELTAEQLTPGRVRFSYAGAEVTGMRHAHLYLHFYGPWLKEEDTEKFWNELNEKASAGVVEVFAQHLNGLLEEQRKAAEEQMRQQLDLLEQERNKLEESIRQFVQRQRSTLGGGSEPLKVQLQELTKRLRDDEIRLIELQAQRAAIEKRIDQLRAQAAEQQQEDPLLAALQGEVERQEQRLEQVRKDLKQHSPIEAANQMLAAQEQMFRKVETLHQQGTIATGEIDKARAQLAEARLRLAQVEIDLHNQQTQQEEKLAQAKIVFLQHQRTSSAGRASTQINKLSDMLDELAIEMDTIAGRREGIETALAQLRGDIQQAVDTESKRKQFDSKINLLQQRKARVDEQLLELESGALHLSPEKIEIVPVVP